MDTPNILWSESSESYSWRKTTQSDSVTIKKKQLFRFRRKQEHSASTGFDFVPNSIPPDVADKLSKDISKIFDQAKKDALDCIRNAGQTPSSTEAVKGRIKHGFHKQNVGSNPKQTCDDSDVQEVDIKDNLMKNKPYILNSVKATDLIALYELFTPVQRKELRCIYRINPTEAIEKVFDEIDLIQNQPDKYRQLVSALDDTGNTKIAKLLDGTIVHKGGRHRDRIRRNEKNICQRLNVTDILPHLYSKCVISEDEKQQIQRKERNESVIESARELLEILPNRQKQWYRLFIEALIESGQKDIADFIEADKKAEVAGAAEHALTGDETDKAIRITRDYSDESCVSRSNI